MNEKINTVFGIRQWGHELYPVAKRKKGTIMIDKCPFCGNQHTHDFGEGHRMAHCTKKSGYSKEITIDGNILHQSKGYFIEEY
jgi:hypothetical protein